MSFLHTTKVDNRLDERAKLRFYFPDPEDLGRSTVITCPFFENPKISEEQSANLIKYDIIGRAGNVFGYTGAKSRSLKVEFSLTLPLLVSLAANRYKAGLGKASMLTKGEKQNLFAPASGTTSNMPKLEHTQGYESYRDQYLRKINDGWTPVPRSPANDEDRFFSPGEFNTQDFDLYVNTHPNEGAFAGGRGKVYKDAVDIMAYWVNVVRASVLNYEPIPTIGPPIIRLTFGTLYRNIATIASNYSINVDDTAGYDNVSLLPRRVKISLNLHEVKQTMSRNSVNEIPKKTGVPEEGDANCGYEVLFQYDNSFSTPAGYPFDALPNLDPGEVGGWGIGPFPIPFPD